MACSACSQNLAKNSELSGTRAGSHGDRYQRSLNGALIRRCERHAYFYGSGPRAVANRRRSHAAAHDVLALPMKQPFVLRRDRAVAFAGCVLQPFEITNLDMAAAVMDHVGVLQRARRQRNAVAPRADH